MSLSESAVLRRGATKAKALVWYFESTWTLQKQEDYISTCTNRSEFFLVFFLIQYSRVGYT